MVSKNVLRGFAHEFLVAKNIIERNKQHAHFVYTPVQQALLKSRMEYAHMLHTDFLTEYNKIDTWAQKSANMLPLAFGSLSFVETSANGGDVYDVQYTNDEENIVKVSCKLSKMEDKAYRFSTEHYIFDKETDILKNLFTQDDVDDGLTFQEALSNKSYTVQKMQSEIVESLAEALRKEESQSYDMFMKLVSERFVGYGGFYKTLPRGNVIFYPENIAGEDSFYIVPGTVETTRTTVKVSMDLKDAHGAIKQRYGIYFRVKFKDGVKKPVKLSASGYPLNVSATVKTVLL